MYVRSSFVLHANIFPEREKETEWTLWNIALLNSSGDINGTRSMEWFYSSVLSEVNSPTSTIPTMMIKYYVYKWIWWHLFTRDVQICLWVYNTFSRHPHHWHHPISSSSPLATAQLTENPSRAKRHSWSLGSDSPPPRRCATLGKTWKNALGWHFVQKTRGTRFTNLHHVGKAKIINHPFVFSFFDTTYLWWFGGWLIIVLLFYPH